MRLLLSAVVVSLVAGGCNVQVGDNGGVSLDVGRGRVTDEWTRTYTLPAGGQVEIVNVNGRIDATGGEGRSVEVQVTREARGGSEEEAQAVMKGVEMREDVTPDKVRIEARADVSGFGRRSFSAAYRLRIPEGLSVSLRTENGPIRVENVSGMITASTTNGGIDGRGVSGSFSAEVINGGVEVEMAAVTGDLSLSSVNGPILVRIPRDTKASLDATAVNGGVSVDDGLAMQVAENSRRRVNGTLNGGGPKITASSVNGGIRIRVLGAESSERSEPSIRSEPRERSDRIEVRTR